MPSVETNIAPLVTLAALGDVDEALARAVVEPWVCRILWLLVEALPNLADQALAARDAIPDAHALSGDPLAASQFERATESVACGLASSNPTRAVEIASQIGTEQLRRSALRAIAEVVANSDIDHARQIVAGFADDDLPQIRMAEIEHVAGTNPDRALAMVEALDEDDRDDALSWVLDALALSDPVRAELLALGIRDASGSKWCTRRSCLDARHHRPTDRPEALRPGARRRRGRRPRWPFGRTVDALFRLAPSDPDRALAVAQRIWTDPGRPAALCSIACAFASRDLPRALELTRLVSDDAMRSWMLFWIINELTPVDSDLAFGVIAGIPDGRWRAEALATLARSLVPVDPARAGR